MYYDALIAAWNNPTQPPPGVTGTPLTAGMTTDQKLTAVNGWTVVGPAVPMIVPTYSVYNLITTAEFNALTDINKQLVRDILFMGTVDISPGTQIRARVVAMFPNGTQTFANLANFAKQYDQPQVPWWRANGYPELITGQDLVNAGLS